MKTLDVSLQGRWELLQHLQSQAQMDHVNTSQQLPNCVANKVWNENLLARALRLQSEEVTINSHVAEVTLKVLSSLFIASAP